MLSHLERKGIEKLEKDFDNWIHYCNQERTHTGKRYYGKTTIQTFLDSSPFAKEKFLERQVLQFGTTPEESAGTSSFKKVVEVDDKGMDNQQNVTNFEQDLNLK